MSLSLTDSISWHIVWCQLRWANASCVLEGLWLEAHKTITLDMRVVWMEWDMCVVWMEWDVCVVWIA
jgi:hypothetical protein